MSKFSVKLPKIVQPGDKMRVRGALTCNAQQFSINFANEVDEPLNNITYHFKWATQQNLIIENFKLNGEWMNHLEKASNRLDGNAFSLEFIFALDAIYVYTEGHNLIARYEPHFELSDIKSLHVWGDVQKILELTLVYE